MGFFTYMGKNKWLKYITLSFMGFIFVFTQVGPGIIQYFTSPDRHTPHMAIIGEKKVDAQDYHKMFAIIQQELMAQQYDKGDLIQYAHLYTWNQFLNKHMYTPLYRSLGIVVPTQEQTAIFEQARDFSFSCFSASPYVAEIPQFQNKDGKLDKSKWNNTIRELTRTEQGKERIKTLISLIKPRRSKVKLVTLVKGLLHTPKAQVAQYPSQKNIRIKYLYIPYGSLTQTGEVTKEDKQRYLDKHTKEYQLEEAREVTYVALPLAPSQEDEALLRDELEALALQFAQTKNPEKFAEKHTIQNEKAICKWTKSTLPPLLRIQLKQLLQDKVIGPIQDGDTYSLYRIIAHQLGTYTVAKLTKKVKTSEYTIHEHLKDLESFKQIKSLKAFKDKVAKEGLKTSNLTMSKKELGYSTGQSDLRRKIQRFLFDPKTKLYTISKPIEEGNHYVICMMTEQVHKGVAPLSKVAHKLEVKIRKQRAGKKIKDNLLQLLDNNKSLKNIAKAYGSEAKVYTSTIKNFEQTQIKSIGEAPKVIGTAFGLKVGTKSTIITDKTGIFIVQRLPNTKKDAGHNLLISKKQKELHEKYEKNILENLYKQCLEQASIQDNRHVYF